MKINGYDSAAVQGKTERTDAAASRTTRETTGSSSSAAASEGTDKVRLSKDLQLLQTATAAAQQAPEIRQDVVAKMRALLDAGQIGNDHERLADALIDSSIETS
jgi:flagellar biosynthesis anti-sigma factor FlgM